MSWIVYQVWQHARCDIKDLIFTSRMIHVQNGRCHRSLNSLSQPLKLSHFIIIVKILTAVRLGSR